LDLILGEAYELQIFRVCDFLHPPANSCTSLRMFHAHSPKYQDKHADQPTKWGQHHITYTCCLCWTAVVRNNSFSKNVCIWKTFYAVLHSTLCI